MKNSRQRVKIVRRRKVANLAAYSRQHTVSNCVIPKADEKEIIDIQVPWSKTPIKGTKWHGYKMPDEGYPQSKSLHKRIHGEKWIKHKDGTIELKKWDYPSTFPTKKFDDYQKKLWKNLGEAAKYEAYVQYKLKKWEKKHPKPCPNDDLFKDEFIPQWEHEKEEALIRIRDFVVSMFDKLPLTGRFKISETGTAQYQEEKIAELKDINGDGHRVNELDKNSKLLKKAQETVNKVHAKRTNLVAGNLKDHKRHKGRVILPKAA